MDKRELEIQSWRSHQRSATIPGEAQPINHLGSPASDQSTPKNLSPAERRYKEDWVLPGERCSRDHTGDDPYSGDSWAKFSSGEHLLLEPSRMMASGAYSSGQTNLNRPFSRGSHRRSQSSLTIWGAYRHLYTLRGGHPISGLINHDSSSSKRKECASLALFSPPLEDVLAPRGLTKKNWKSANL